MAITIYHNPRCSKSRMTLQLIIDAGVGHNVVLYTEDVPDGQTIAGLAEKLDLAVADLLRRGESDFKNATDLPQLDDDAALANWLSLHPSVLERPIVVDDDSGDAVIGRPPENVLPLLNR